MSEQILYRKEIKVTSCFLYLIKQHLHLLSVIYNLQTISNILETKWIWSPLTEWYISQFPLICMRGSLWRFTFLVNRKFGFVFDRVIADIRWFSILIFKDPSFVHKPGSFYKYRRDTDLISPDSKDWKCAEIDSLFYANVQHLYRSINWIVRWVRNVFFVLRTQSWVISDSVKACVHWLFTKIILNSAFFKFSVRW